VTIFGITPEESIEINQIEELLNLQNVNCRLINIQEDTFADVDIRNTFNKMRCVNSFSLMNNKNFHIKIFLKINIIHHQN
jgi:hypothetical protein